MAEHADGSIIVDTEIDTEGFKAGSSELQRAIKSLNGKMDALGPTFQKALSGNASAISTFDAKAAALESTISDIEAKMESLGTKRVPTEDYQWLTTEIQKAKNELVKLEEKQIKMEDTGVKKNSRAWQTLQYDIDLAKRKIAEYEGEQATMRADGSAFQMGSNTAEYSQLESALASAKARLADMQAQAEGARNSTSRLAKVGNTVKSAFSKIGSVGKKAFSGCAKVVGNVATKLKGLIKSSNGAMGAVNKLGKKISGFGSTLKRMALRQLMSGIITAVKDGFNNLAQYSAQANADMSALKSGLTQLKNSFATAFAPVLTVVTPALTKLMNYLSMAITYVGKLFAALSGAKTFTKAVAVQEDYAASLGSTGKAAKDAQRQLAGFDELNVLTDSSSSDSGGETGSADPSEMFEEVPIESSITDFVGRIKDAFVNGDYDAIGEIIGNGINTAIQKVNDFISWDNLGSKVTAGIKGIAKGFNALVDTVDWKNIGDTFAKGFNTAINTLFLVLTKFDWPGLAAGFANSLNGLVTGIDWGKLGTTLSTGLSTAIATLRSAITTFDWASLGKGIADAIDNIDWVGLLSDLAGGISDILKGALDLLIGFAENLDWGKLGSDLWNGLIGIITNIDWGGIISKAFQLLGNALGGAVSLIVEFCKSLWESLKSGFEATKSYFNTYIEEAGGNVVEGIFKGIGDALKNIGNWIVENIWNPFIEGFKNAFGIHSPSTKMAEMGGFLIEGLLNGIENLWSSITGFFSESLGSIGETISGAWSSVKQEASKKWSEITGTLSSSWESIKSTASGKFNSLKSTITGKWTEIKSDASTKWSSIKGTLNEKWVDIKGEASKKWGEVKGTISGVFDTLKNDAPTWGSDLCENMASGIKKAKQTVSEAVEGVAEKIKGFLGFSEPDEGPLSNFHTYMPDMIDLMTKGIKQNQGQAIGAVSDMASAISSEIQNGDYTIGNVRVGKGVNTALTDFSDSITDGFFSLLDRLQAIAKGVTFTTPAVATGTIVPYKVSAVTNGETGVKETIETSNEELGSVVIQVVTNATAAIVDAIQKNGGKAEGFDINALTTSVIDETNRRTIMTGQPQILT